MVSYGFPWKHPSFPPVFLHDLHRGSQNLPPFQLPLPFWPDSAGIQWKSHGHPMGKHGKLITMNLVHQATCENTKRNHQKRVGDIYLAMSLCFDHASMQMQWRGSTLSIDADFSTSQTVSLPKCKLPKSTMLVYWRYNGCIYIYPSILTYPKLMQIGCINPQVDIMGAELPGYNGCILVYIGIMDVLKKKKHNIQTRVDAFEERRLCNCFRLCGLCQCGWRICETRTECIMCIDVSGEKQLCI